MPAEPTETADLSSPEAYEDPLEFYQKHCQGMTRSKLQRQLPALYKRLRRRGLLGRVPLKPKRFGSDPLAYYRKHYAGLTRGQLSNKVPGLYDYLRRHGLLGDVPLRRIDFPDPLAYYEEHCAGMTRAQAAKHEPRFYRHLQQNGLLGTIPFALAVPFKKPESPPPSPQTGPAAESGGDFPETEMETAPSGAADIDSPEARQNPLAFYRQHYKGWTQDELFAQVPRLYLRLGRKRKLGRIPRERQSSGGDAAGRDTRQPTITPDILRKRRPVKPADQGSRRFARLSAARLECFRVIPEPE